MITTHILYYAGGILLLTGLLAWVTLASALRLGTSDSLLAMLAIPVALGASHLAVSIINWLSAVLIGPRPLPKLDFSLGIPPDRQSLVVIPTMLESAADCDSLLEGLEVRHLANRDDNLWFAILTDFTDAPTENQPGDKALLDYTRQAVQAMNEKHRGERDGPFVWLHRPRQWNPREGVWMGWERKRGKLEDLNAFLRGRGEDRFSEVVGEFPLPQSIKYVITLDTDTQLPRDAARKLVGAISHPLNKARYNPEKGRVCEGYAILQPRVAVSLPGTSRSWYARLFAAVAALWAAFFSILWAGGLGSLGPLAPSGLRGLSRRPSGAAARQRKGAEANCRSAVRRPGHAPWLPWLFRAYARRQGKYALRASQGAGNPRPPAQSTVFELVTP